MVVINLPDSAVLILHSTQGRSVSFWMTAYVAFASSERGALPGRSTTTEYTFAWVAASASVVVRGQSVFSICQRVNERGRRIERK
jgi:hypothetical protein